MKNIFGKVLRGAILLYVILVCGVYAGAYNVGDVTGTVLSTDIVTYIEGVKVPSYNINGRTAIVAQHLNSLGGALNFGVNFDEQSRVLTIADSDVYGTGGDVALSFEENKSAVIGKAVGNVLYTDITTNFDGNHIDSFNIGGLTCIYADDLAKFCGTYLWDENARTVNVYRNGSYIPSVTKHTSSRMLGAGLSEIFRSDTFYRWGDATKSNLAQNADGTFTAVEVDEHINIEVYDSSFRSIKSYAIKKELPLFGGMLFGEKYNYIVFGQENLLDDSSREVIRVVIYDKNFVKISEVSINNCKTAIPFDASGGDIYENERYLILHTSRSQYLDENNTRPQTQLTVIIDKTTWQVVNMLGKFQYNHTSHALREFVRIDKEKIITANYSDAAPIRGAFLQELDFEGKVLHTQSIFNVGGPLAANCTGAMIGGFEVGENGYFVPMSTIDHSLPTGYSNVNIEGPDRENRDIYLLYTDKETYEMRHTCLARYTGVMLSGSVPYIVKLENDSYMVLWQRFSDDKEESSTLCYAFSDGNGNQVGAVYTMEGKLSKWCQPIHANGRVIWYVNTVDGRDFYSVSAVLPHKEEITNEPLLEDVTEKEINFNENNIVEVDGI